MTDDTKLSERQRLKIARSLASESEKNIVVEAWVARREAMNIMRGGELPLPDHDADEDIIRSRLRVRAMSIVEDIMLHSLSEENQLKAAQIAVAIEACAASQPLAATIPGLAHPTIRAHVVDDAQLPSGAAPDPEKIHHLLVLARKAQR